MAGEKGAMREREKAREQATDQRPGGKRRRASDMH